MEKPKVCGTCGKVGAPHRCPCKAALYSDERCQRSNWSSHKGLCTWHLEQKIEKDRRRLGSDSTEVGQAAFKLGALLAQQDRFADAETWLVEAFRISQVPGMAGKNRHLTMAGISSMLGSVYFKQGKLEEGVKNLELSVREFGLGGHGESSDAAASLMNLGNALAEQGRKDCAMEKLEEARAMFSRTLGENDAKVAHCLGNMASLLDTQGKYAESKALQDKALEMRLRTVGSGHDSVAVSLLNQGGTCHEQGNDVEALAKMEQALSIVRANHPERCSLEGRILGSIGSVYTEQGKHEDALPMFKKAHRIFLKTVGPDTLEVSQALHNMSVNLSLLERNEEAVEKCGEALRICRLLHGDEHEEVTSLLVNLGSFRDDAGDVKGAIECYREAHKTLTKVGDLATAADVKAEVGRLGGAL